MQGAGQPCACGVVGVGRSSSAEAAAEYSRGAGTWVLAADSHAGKVRQLSGGALPTSCWRIKVDLRAVESYAGMLRRVRQEMGLCILDVTL